MTQNNIHFERATYEYTNGDGRQVYKVISQDLTQFSPTQTFQKTVAVMNVVSTDGTAGIYVTEASFSQDTITYTLKQNGQTIDSAQVNIILPTDTILLPNPDPAPSQPNRPWCPGDLTPARVDQLLRETLDKANQTCRSQIIRYKFRCSDYIAIIYPTFPECRRTSWAGIVFQETITRHMLTFDITVRAPLSGDALTDKDSLN